MSKEQHYPPVFKEGKFHCPHCDVFAKQFWSNIIAGHVHNGLIENGIRTFSENLDNDWCISRCDYCDKKIIWLSGEIIYPRAIFVVAPNKDLSDDIQNDYHEAARVLIDSPRSSAAILRLALQKLCKQLGEKGVNINHDIGELVKKGLNPSIQKSLDALRITGNNALHPGELDLKEDSERVIRLFNLINFIAEKMISEPKEIDSFYKDLPESDKQAVEKRDSH